MFDQLLTIIFGVLLIKFSTEVSSIAVQIPVLRAARDASSPVTFKILGGLAIIYGIGMLFLSL